MDSSYEFQSLQSLFKSIYYYYYYYYYFTLLRVFHTSVNWWFITEVWVIASLFKSPGPFLVFWDISTMLFFGWSPLVRSSPNPPAPASIFWWLYWAPQLQLVLLSPLCSIFFQFFSIVMNFLVSGLFSLSARLIFLCQIPSLHLDYISILPLFGFAIIFHFLQTSILIFSWFGSFIPSTICRFPLFIISEVHFSMPNSIPTSWFYISTACIRVTNYFSFLGFSIIFHNLGGGEIYILIYLNGVAGKVFVFKPKGTTLLISLNYYYYYYLYHHY